MTTIRHNPTRPTATLFARSAAHRGPGLLQDALKRLCDITGATMGLVLTLPVMAACGLWIKLVDGGPVLYHQWRVGRDGWLFPIYKLRTMRCDAERAGKAQLASAGDSRIIPGCAWMRRSHIDEFPQFWNILVGDMSLVGPRPERPEIMRWLDCELPGFDRRLAARPGLTGLAQLYNGYSNDLASTRRKLAYDLRYLRGRSVLGDFWLVMRTMPRFWDRSAY